MGLAVKDLCLNGRDGGLFVLEIKVECNLEEIGTLLNKKGDYLLELKKVRKHRTLDANSYYQVLLDKLSQALYTKREELHEEMLREYGVTMTYSDGEPVYFPLQFGRDGHELVKYCEAVRCEEIDGRDFIWWRAIKPSHLMDTVEFSRLLDGLIYECKNLGIETLTPQQIRELQGYVKV